MGDFHEYYSGSRTAPYLTIFVGGNHEASNHLFELYYGGWAAPNIYYLGAANILRLGPLRLAGLSGIWKGYDYRKPHFERLPYNRDDINSIYHVREVDVRKLLSIRTQVDIGLSHDWPQGVEWLGDYQELYKCKDRFEADANEGKLGSIAAKQCLARLRPPHWFSAHLHIKYSAVVEHPEYEETPIPTRQNSRAPAGRNQHSRGPAVRSEDQGQVAAWGQFHAQAIKIDAEDNDRTLKEQQSLKEQEGKTGVRKQPTYTFNETFKQVKTDDNLGRAVKSVLKEERPLEEVVTLPQLDGCIDSKPGSLKRRRQTSNPDELGGNASDNEQPNRTNGVDSNATAKRADTAASSTVVAGSPGRNLDAIDLAISIDEEPTKAPISSKRTVPSQMDGGESSKKETTISGAKNPDSIEIEFSDEEEPTQGHGNVVGQSQQSAAIAIPTSRNSGVQNPSAQHQAYMSLSSDPDEDGGMSLNPAPSSFRPMASMASILQNDPQPPTSRSTSHHSMEGLDLIKAPAEVDGHETVNENIISDDMRAKLTELNPSFAQHEPIEKSPALPFPEGIANTTTQFLALDKCEPKRHFLQLLEIDIGSQEQGDIQSRPYKLQYDPEWLAILRVFAPELQVGGNSSDRVPQDRGETYYRQRILEEEDYVKKHVLEAGLIDVPNNFSITAPVYNPNIEVDSRDMPREVTNPQTSAFCSMIGIENPFEITEEERDARITQGARPEQERFKGGRGRGGGRGGSNDRGGGRRGGGRGARAGRGRGRWS
jgi:lariat debranching enzyme